MCWFFNGLKLLILKILLAGLMASITAAHYNYGYHPSAEEFDNLLSETRRTWTYNFLKADRDRLLYKPFSWPKTENSPQPQAKYFVPKFQYENEENKNQEFNKNQQFDLQTVSSSNKKHSQLPLKNIGSTLDFNYFSNELPKPLINKVKTKPLSTTATTIFKPPTIFSPDSSALPEINLKPLAKPDVAAHKNTTHDNFPIYFTNPATGIVYAISEVGKTEQNFSKSNGSIPIFVTKEQYEQDINRLKETFKRKCTQTKMQKKPLISMLPITATKFSPPSIPPLKKPSPVVVKTEIIVKDKPTNSSLNLRPLRKKNKKSKTKRKTKKTKPPGHKTIRSTTIAPQHDGPVIILGSKDTTTLKPILNNEKVSTQLEKPNFDNIFSSAAAPYGFHLQQEGLIKPFLVRENHQVRKRSPPQAEKKQNNKFSEKFQNKSTEATKSTQLTTKFQKDNTDSISNYKSEKKKIDLENLQPPGATQKKKEFKSIFKTNLGINKNNKKSYKGNENVNNFTKKRLNYEYNSYLATEAPDNKELQIQTEFIFQIENNVVNMTNVKNVNKNNSSENFKALLENKSLNKLNENKTKSANFIEFFLKNYKESAEQKQFQTSFNEHHVNKRSVNNLKPKFIKKFNFTENPKVLGNSSVVSERSIMRDKQNISNQFEIIKTSNKSTQNVRLKKLKRKSKIKSNANNAQNKLLNSNLNVLKKNAKKRKAHKTMGEKPKREQEADYYLFDDYDEDEDEEDEDYEDDGDDDDEDDEEEDKAEEEDNDSEIYVYDDTASIPTREVDVSVEDFTEKTATQETKNSYEEEDNDNSALQIEHIKFKASPPPVLDYDNSNKVNLKTKPTSLYYKKRIRRRPQLKIDRDDYDYDDDDEDNSLGSNLGNFFRMVFYPIQVVMGSVIDSLAAKDTQEEDPYTHYTSYHNTLKQHTKIDEYDEDYDSNESSSSLLSNWFTSWFGFNRRNKKIGSTTVAPVQPKPTKASSWLPSWLGGFGNNDRISTESTSTEDYDEYDKWFASWFGETKPKARKRTTTTTSTTTQIPHVPILTIVDPMKNPQNWIGILAHHIINHTSTSTVNPLKDMWSKVITTTTENPEIPKKISYDKYQIWRLKPQDDTQVKALEEYKKSEDGIKLQWLKGPSLRGLTDVLVPPKMLVDFQASLTFELIDHEVLIFDVGKAIAYEKTKEDYFFTTTQKPKKHQNKLSIPSVGMTWRKYYEYDDIIKYLETMRMRFPHLVELIHIGRSYEGRPLIIMKIESKEAAEANSAHYPAHQHNKLRHKKRIGLANAVFIEAGTHGMEWIGPATATWIINELLRIMKKNISDDHSFMRNTTWYIMPILNPDGYVYSHEYDRFWKKSRSRHISRPSGLLNSAMTWLQKKRAKEKVCFGVDLDRNWHYQWGRRGSSKTPCNEFYAGPTPFSEPETKALSEFLMDYRTQIKLFISMQSYGQIISYPYKANTTYDTERLDDLLDVAMVGTDGLRKKGSKSRYKIDSSNDLVENRSGCSDAFAAYEVGIPFSYTLQLADNGVHGYLLPSASIESTAKDAFEIITGMLDYI